MAKTKKELLAEAAELGVTDVDKTNSNAEIQAKIDAAAAPEREFSSLLERDTTEADNIQRPTIQPTDVIDDRSNGTRVVALQAVLAYSGIHVQVDGQFGRQTRLAVEAFQVRHGLEVTGVVDRDTWLAAAEYLVANQG